MRKAVPLVLMALLSLATPLAAAHGGTAVHSPNVEDAHNVPESPVAGQDVSIHLYVTDDSKIEFVRAVYCRVQRYACAPAFLMKNSSPNIYDGVIAWKNNSRFFEGVTQVGYKFEIKYVDGTNETTPLTHYPERPKELPEGGDKYYYYTLEAAPESPSPGFLWILALALLPLAWRKRR